MKKQKSIKLAVPKPCSESWSNMSPNNNGRHCSSCEKTVIDFSKFSDAEIYQALVDNSSKVCGRFSAFQLNRSIFPQIQINSSLFPKILFSAAIAACTISAVNAQDSFAEVTTQTIDLKNNASDSGPEFGRDSSKYIRGKIIDAKTGEAIPFVTVFVKELKKGSITDQEGNFKIKVTDDFPDTIILATSMLGYYENKITLIKNKIPEYFELRLDQAIEEVVGELIIIKEPKHKSLKKRKRQ